MVHSGVIPRKEITITRYTVLNRLAHPTSIALMDE